ncbi:MAG: BatD family protein [Bacteroidaceae bacterium]|nr:BatD family protein [Bacteroidaceae bacterium]
MAIHKETRLMTLCLLCAVSALQAMAQSATFKASAPTMVEVGERFRVQYSVSSQNVSNFSYPSFDGFDVIYGPSTSSQSNIQIINGKMSQSSSYTYTFTLMAQKTGTYTIPAASIVVDGETLKSQSLKIQVVASSGTRQPQGQQGRQRQTERVVPQAQGTSISASDLFMTATASRTRVYEQEAVLVTYKVYTLVNLQQLDGKLPTLDGFQIQEIDLPRNKEFTTENYNGRIYHTVVWSQYVLFPQKSGDLVIPAITYEGVVVQQNRAMDPIEAFFNGTGGLIEVKKKITTPQLTIHVTPLPDKPADFSGAVGQFSISSSLSADKVKANDAITLKLAVKGTGNMKLISAPEIEFPKDFETYDAKVTDNFSLTRSGLTGTKEFEYLAVPRHGGQYTIPAARFVYFDTATQTYKTLTTEPYTINVEKGTGGTGTAVSDYTNMQQDVKQLNQDIRYIKTGNTVSHSAATNYLTSWTYWALYLIPLILFAIAMAVGYKQIKDNANIAKARGKKANKVAKKRLKAAERYLHQHNQAEFYDEVMRALWGYIADKLNISQAQLNKDNISAELDAKQVDAALTSQFIQTLNQCEYARYAPGNPDENMEAVYNSAADVISKMENNIRHSAGRNQKTTATFSLILLAAIMTSATISAQTKQQADQLYADEKYEAAAKIYQTLIENEGPAPELYYNLAGCYYKQGDVAHAVLNYERALKLQPGDTDIRANLELARSKTTDKVTPPSQMFFITWWNSFTNIMHINTWLVIALCMFTLMLIGILAVAFMTNTTARRVGIYVAVAAMTLTIVTILSALSCHIRQVNHPQAIVMTSAVTVKSSPSDTSTDLFVMHEGTKVEITDNTMSNWCEVKLEEGKMGWVPAAAIEEI